MRQAFVRRGYNYDAFVARVLRAIWIHAQALPEGTVNTQMDALLAYSDAFRGLASIGREHNSRSLHKWALRQEPLTERNAVRDDRRRFSADAGRLRSAARILAVGAYCLFVVAR